MPPVIKLFRKSFLSHIISKALSNCMLVISTLVNYYTIYLYIANINTRGITLILVNYYKGTKYDRC